ncbi:insulinase family protein [Catenovulum sp. 2E275]|uniref:insulinase family protein n=1 Tax=Catenovulum sp. 2E275 TaxID=2980497 RepID=UPI0021CFB70C|nr:insulinase family protein [Catenovulum sp. 2E275]MCU4676922.1 insulinase family protein [Catenovulum sp. 2E275]
MKTNMVKTFLSVSVLSACLAACQNAEVQSSASAKTSAQQATNNLPAEYIKQDVFIKNVKDQRQYKYLKLENDLQVILVSDPNVKTAAAALSVGVGSNQNPDNFLGLAHYLEHMVIQSSKKYPQENEIAEFVAKNAGARNAFTALDNTTYLFQINSDALDGALDRLGAAIAEPLFEPSFSDRERNAVNSEWSRNLNSSDYDIQSATQQIMNPDYPGSRFTTGNLETLTDQPDKTLNQALWDFYNQYYSANIMTLAIVSNQPLDELASKAKTHFSAIKNKNIKKPEISELAFTQTGQEINIKIPKDTNYLQLQLPLDYQADSKYSHAGQFILRQLNRHDETALLGGLRKAGLTHDAGCGYAENAYQAQGFMQCHFNLTDKGLADKNQVVTAFFEYVNIIKQQAVTDDYIAEYEYILQSQRQRFSDTPPLQFAVKLATTLQQHDPEYTLMPNQYYKGFDKKRVNEILAQLKPNNMIVRNIGKDVSADTPIPYSKRSYSVKALPTYQAAETLEVALKLPAAQVPDELKTEQIAKETAEETKQNYVTPIQVINQNGVTAFLATSQYFADDNEAVTEATIESPATNASAKNMIMNHIISDLFNKQTKALSENAKLMDAVDFYAKGNAHSFSFFTINGKLAHQQKYFTQALTQFRELKIDQQIFDNIKASFIQGYENMAKQQPIQQTLNSYRETYKIYAEVFTKEEKLAALKSLTLKDLTDFHQTLLKGQLQIYSMSNMSKAELAQMAKSGRDILGKAEQASWQLSSDFKPEIGKNVNVTESIDANDVVLFLGFIPQDDSKATKTNLMVLNQFMHPAFFNEIRTQQQLGYIVQSSAWGTHDYTTQAFLVQSNNTELNQVYSKVLTFIQSYQAELAKLTDEQIKQTVSAIIQQLEQKPTDLKQEFAQYHIQWRDHKWTFDEREKLISALKNVNKTSLTQLYDELLLQGKHEQFAIQYRGENFKDTDFAKLKSLSEVESQGQQTAAR